MSDRHRVPENELSDSEDEGEGRRDRQSHKQFSSTSSAPNRNKPRMSLLGSTSNNNSSSNLPQQRKEKERVDPMHGVAMDIDPTSTNSPPAAVTGASSLVSQHQSSAAPGAGDDAMNVDQP